MLKKLSVIGIVVLVFVVVVFVIQQRHQEKIDREIAEKNAKLLEDEERKDKEEKYPIEYQKEYLRVIKEQNKENAESLKKAVAIIEKGIKLDYYIVNKAELIDIERKKVWKINTSRPKFLQHEHWHWMDYYVSVDNYKVIKIDTCK